MSDPILIVDYDPLWPVQFQQLQARIAAVLGLIAAAIEHVGSTSVPGLAAKAIIDVDILLHSPTDVSEAIIRLSSLGYEHRGDLGVPGRESFRQPPNTFQHHLYVCLPGFPEFNRHITFRNHLRSHPPDAEAYANLKRDLGRRYRDNRDAYTQAKTELVEAILHRARTS